MVGSFPNSDNEFIELANFLMNPARAKHLLEVVLASFTKFWFEKKAITLKTNSDQLLKDPCSLVQADFSSLPAHPTPFSSNQLT
ncbi:hypothetical protein J1N35_005319 [Gossypium stocksii]|uniref:Uncharacterized protein n=1 Tax=Gossypium stocksii TaxID=47602 RepID=A0A9D3WCN3_9ROSI|nr:hypothetical protein J1N35_005319 [Gossypium stocksii]